MTDKLIELIAIAVALVMLVIACVCGYHWYAGAKQIDRLTADLSVANTNYGMCQYNEGLLKGSVAAQAVSIAQAASAASAVRAAASQAIAKADEVAKGRQAENNRLRAAISAKNSVPMSCEATLQQIRRTLQ